MPKYRLFPFDLQLSAELSVGPNAFHHIPFADAEATPPALENLWVDWNPDEGNVHSQITASLWECRAR